MTPFHAPHAGPIRLMLVDDHAVVRAGYRRYLEADAHFRVVAEADSGESAYDWLVNCERQEDIRTRLWPDVLVLDLSLQGRSGLDLLRRCSKRFPALKVLVFTMHEHATLVEQALDAGAYGYATKSAPPESIRTALMAVATGSRWVDPALQARLADTERQRDAMADLTPREIEILRLLLAGHTTDEVAHRLALSPKTVANHHTAIKQKLGADNDIQMVRKARLLGLPLLDDPPLL